MAKIERFGDIGAAMDNDGIASDQYDEVVAALESGKLRIVDGSDGFATFEPKSLSRKIASHQYSAHSLSTSIARSMNFSAGEMFGGDRWIVNVIDDAGGDSVRVSVPATNYAEAKGYAEKIGARYGKVLEISDNPVDGRNPAGQISVRVKKA